MGWGYGIENGKEIGYTVDATCDEPECEVEIDRGLAHACGGMHGENEHCDGYFCGAHLHWDGVCGVWACQTCINEIQKEITYE